MKEKIIRREVQEHMIITHAGPHATYAALVYREDGVHDEIFNGKKTAMHFSRYERGNALHPHQIKDPEKAYLYQEMVAAAARLNRAIIAIVEGEEKQREEERKKSRKKRRK